MLVLTRQYQQCIRIGKHGEIVVKVLSSKGGNVRLGIEAPEDIPVDREEVFWLKQQRFQEEENLSISLAPMDK